MRIGADVAETTPLRARALADIREFIDSDDTPRSIDEVNVAWIESRINAAGHDISLAGFQAAALGAGLMGNTFRLTLEHAGSAVGKPASVVFKCTGDSPVSRQLGKRGFGIEGRPGFYAAEIRFYGQFSEQLPICVPRAYASWMSAEEDEFSLLLEDFPDGRPGDEFAGCSRDEVMECMIGLAGLHAPLWNDPIFREDSWLKPISADLKPLLNHNMHRAMVRLKERHLARFSPEDIELIEAFAPHYGEWICADGRIVSLTHGDYRMDNMLFDRNRSVVLDWQTFASAHPGRDTGLFLGCSVPTDIRRDVQGAALKAYHGRLLELGVKNYSMEQCFDDFLFGTFIGLQNVIIGMNAVPGTDRGTQMFMNKLARCKATIIDHDTLARFFI